MVLLEKVQRKEKKEQKKGRQTRDSELKRRPKISESVKTDEQRKSRRRRYDGWGVGGRFAVSTDLLGGIQHRTHTGGDAKLPGSSYNLGKPVVSEMDEFPENFRRGVGVVSDPKNFVAIFLH